MPIETAIPLHRFDQAGFGEVAYAVVGHAFRVHAHLGRIFHESVYRSTLSGLLGDRAVEETGIRLSHQGFEKDLFMDLVVDAGCPFELKVVSRLTDKHRGQLIQYLMLTDLSHGKLINFGAERVEHEFVNCHETTEHRRRFEVDKGEWSAAEEVSRQFENIVVGLLRDWGTGLDRAIYHEAVVAMLGGPELVRGFVNTFWEGRVTGRQAVALLDRNTSFEITAFRSDLEVYLKHLTRFLMSTELEKICWVNVVSGRVRFCSIRRDIGKRM